MIQEISNLLLAVILAVIASVVFGIATPLFKKCTQPIGKIGMEFKKDIKGNLKKILNKYFVIAAILQLLGWLIFITAISRYEVSVITPVLAMTYVFTAFYASIVLKERLTKKEVIGIIVIILGVIILTFPFNLF
jgi:drug/metabolite transporter (DMT)-like permease